MTPGILRFMDKQVKILIVEAEMPLAMQMISVLTHFNYDADAVHKGKKAMELAARERFDLIILDVELPDVPAFEICTELRQRHISYKTPIIFLSTNPTPEKIAEIKKRGGTDCLPKPFDVTEFIYKVTYYTRARRLMSQESEGIVA